MAEWLRRLTRNQISSGSVGSNPTNCVLICMAPISAIRNVGNGVVPIIVYVQVRSEASEIGSS